MSDECFDKPQENGFDRLSPRIRVVMFPKDTNAMGNIFGGVILSYIDVAAAQEARDLSSQLYVTKVFREVEFIAPVSVGDTLSCYTKTTRIGRTSVTVEVLVEARKWRSKEVIKVTQAEVVMVAIGDDGRPQEIMRS